MPRTVSLYAPLSSQAEYGLTLADLLPAAPSELDSLERRELDRLAGEHAAARLGTMTHRERMVLLVRALDLAFSHAAVTAAAECGRTMLSRTYRQLLDLLIADIRKALPREEPDTVREIVLRCYEKLCAAAMEWGRENGLYERLSAVRQDRGRMTAAAGEMAAV